MQPIPIVTKVRLPQRRSDVLRRPRLLDFLHEHVDRRLILLCTGAGYGKTTLLTDFAHEVDLPVCWYSMDSADADPRTFFEYLLLSLRQRFPGFGRQTEAALRSANDVARETSTLVATLVNEIQAEIQDLFLLVLDDYYWVDDSEAVNAAVDMLIYYLPDNCRLVVSTRLLPHFTFSRLAAQRQVAGLGTSDLRFTAEELAHLLRDNYRMAVPATQAERLVEASEGWITGILLTTHTLWMGLVETLVKAKRKKKGAGSPLFDYLASEVYQQQPPDVRRFLLCSSVLDQVSPELCDRLFAGGTAADTLDYLTRANLFITELEGPGEWYRYHNLFQDFLRARLKAEDPALHVQLHQRAGEMAEEGGAWDNSVAHYHQAGSPASAAALVERVGEEMMQCGRWKTLYTWLDSLSPDVVEARPRLALYRGRTYLWSGELDRAVGILDRSSQLHLAQSDPVGGGAALTLKSAALRFRGRPVEAMEACARALALQPDPRSTVAAEAHRESGICLAAVGRLAEAKAEMERSLEIYEAMGDKPGVATLARAMGTLSSRMGDPGRAMAFHRRALEIWRQLGNPGQAAGVLNCIATVYHCTGEYEAALPVLDESLALARQAGFLRSEAFALATLGDVRRDSGNSQGALESYQAALEIAQRTDEVPLVSYLLDAIANTHRLLGDYATAERLLRQALQLAEESQSSYEVATYTVSAAVLAEEQGDLARAEELLRDAMARLASSGAARELARARFHLARTRLAGGDQAGAAAEMEASLELCRQLGYDQFMVAEGQRAGPLIGLALARGLGGRRVELLAERIRRVQHPEPAGKRQRMWVEASSPRSLKAHALGEARVQVDARQVTMSDWKVERTKELFFYLLEQPQSPRRDQIIEVFWPDLDEGKGASQLHSTVFRLRRAIFPQCLAFEEGRYRLTLGDILWYDVEEFTRLLEEVEAREASPEQCIAGYERALKLYQGPFLEQFYSDWITPRREDLEQRYLRALIRLARLQAGAGALERAAELLRAAVATDPYREDAHYGLILYTAQMGDPAGALRHYRGYVQLLKEELGARPSTRVSDLTDRIARGGAIPSR